MTSAQPRIAVLVPCYNEDAAVATVVADFRKALPAAEIYVYDNNSRDRTAAVAREAGAIVRSERRQGKGHVVRRMFADIERNTTSIALRNMATTALLVATSAWSRRESRGAHYRADYPAETPALARRTMTTLAEARAVATSLAARAPARSVEPVSA